MTPTNVLVRVQAKGGKYIGPDAGYALVTVRDATNGNELAQGIAAGGSGNLSPSFSAGASREVIVTTQLTGAQNLTWLSALPVTTPPAAGLLVSLNLAAPTLVEFTAQSLTNGQPNGHYITETMWLTPGANLTSEPGLVLVIPGLLVNVLSFSPGKSSVGVTAWVTMMCGCKIDPTLPWLPTEFTVTATVLDRNGRVVVQPQQLGFQSTSTFGTTQPLQLPGPGSYTMVINAVQPLEANAGSASAAFSVAG